MVPNEDMSGSATPEEETPRPGALSARSKALIVLAVGLVFVVLITMRMADGMQGAQPLESVPTADSPGANVPDPVAAYEAALAADRPIYVLFHSSNCPSCVEITATAERVLPGYAGDITFVDVYTDDPRARPLFGEFAFQYIPTSFFLTSDGDVADQHTGTLSEDELRERLDALAAFATDG